MDTHIAMHPTPIAKRSEATARPIQFFDNTILRGCNAYHTRSVIRLRIDFGKFEGKQSVWGGSAFADAFLRRFQGLKTLVPNNGMRQAFIDRLTSDCGIDFEEIVLEAILATEAAVAFAMNYLDRVSFAVLEKHDGYSDLIWECAVEKLSYQAAEVGVTGTVELLPEDWRAASGVGSENFDTSLDKLLGLGRGRKLSRTTSILRLAAKNRGFGIVRYPQGLRRHWCTPTIRQ